MSIQKHIVSNDKTIYEAWPDIVQTNSGKLICVFTECVSHSDRHKSKIVMCESYDRGRTWSGKKAFTEECGVDYIFNCARISKINDGRIAVVCDKIPTGTREDTGMAETYLWYGDDEGENWNEPQILNFKGIVPDKLRQLKNGRLLITNHYRSKKSGMLEQHLHYSDDNGATWSEDILVAADERYHLCEASIIECRDGTLVALMRENSGLGYDCFKSISYDSGQSWSGVYHVPIPGCHRPVAGFLSDGSVMISYLFCHNTLRGNRNTFLAFCDEDALKQTERSKQKTTLYQLDFDRSLSPDTGYTGWTQFSDGEVYIVNYIKDNEEKAQIRGYSFKWNEKM